MSPSQKVRSLALILLLTLPACLHSPKRPAPPEPGATPSGKFLLPLKHAEVLSKFGPRGDRYHTGIDLRWHRGGGDEALASRDGIVVRSKVFGGYGKLIEIQHADGFSTRYAHLKKFSVHLGQRVKAGQAVGIVGRTGRATTEHLHFEILTPRSHFLDPALYISPDR